MLRPFRPAAPTVRRYRTAWTPAKGLEFLPSLNATGFSQGTDVNESGAVVGYVDLGFPIRPFIWSKRTISSQA